MNRSWSGDLYNAEARGTDVGCSYGRGPFGRAVSKLTIFAIKAGPSATLDSVFAHYRDEMHQTYPDGTNAQPSIRMQGTPPADFPEVRSEEIDILMGGHRYKTEVIVFLRSGWIVEIRATYRTEINANEQSAAAGFASDVAASSLALMQAVGSVGKNP